VAGRKVAFVHGHQRALLLAAAIAFVAALIALVLVRRRAESAARLDDSGAVRSADPISLSGR
jgi:hypothetical protein